MIFGNPDQELLHKRKEKYRKELLAQIDEQRKNKRREKELELCVAASGAHDPEKMANRLKQSSVAPRFSDQKPLPERSQATVQAPPHNTALPSSGPGSSVNEELQKVFSEVVLPRVTAVPPPPPPVLTYAYKTPYDEAYNYYGVRNPLDSNPEYYGPGRMGVQPAPLPNAPVAELSSQSAGKTSTPDATKERIKIYGMVFEDKPKATKEAIQAYQKDLEQQIRDKEEKRKKEKEELAQYEAKIAAEMRNYNPWGKDGAGAPLRDAEGKLLTDLNTMHKQNIGAYYNPDVRIHEEKRAVVIVNPNPAPPNAENMEDSANKTSASGVEDILSKGLTPFQIKKQESYMNFLQMQMKEKEERRRKDKEELARYETKMEAEMRNYNPFGEDGSGIVGVQPVSFPSAPMAEQSSESAVKANGPDASKERVRASGMVFEDRTKAMKESVQAYQKDLEQQIKEKEERRKKEKEDLERYEAKMEAQRKMYNPWGKGGAGAPLRDEKGNLITSPDEDIFSKGLTPRQIRKQESYMNFLRMQIEEKKQRAEAERERLKIEEDKEEKRLTAQRARIQQEYEEEQKKQRQKEEEQRVKSEELIKFAEERRKEAERKKEEKQVQQQEKKVTDEEEIKKDCIQSRVPSPYVSTTKNQLPDDERRKILDSLAALRRRLHTEEQRVQKDIIIMNHENEKYLRKRENNNLNASSLGRLGKQVLTRPHTYFKGTDPHTMRNIYEFNELKSRDSETREHVRNMFPSPPNDDETLDIQQQALLREQQKQLNKMKMREWEEEFETEDDDPPDIENMLTLQEQAQLRAQQKKKNKKKMKEKFEEFESIADMSALPDPPNVEHTMTLRQQAQLRAQRRKMHRKKTKDCSEEFEAFADVSAPPTPPNTEDILTLQQQAQLRAQQKKVNKTKRNENFGDFEIADGRSMPLDLPNFEHSLSLQEEAQVRAQQKKMKEKQRKENLEEFESFSDVSPPPNLPNSDHPLTLHQQAQLKAQHKKTHKKNMPEIHDDFNLQIMELAEDEFRDKPRDFMNNSLLESDSAFIGANGEPFAVEENGGYPSAAREFRKKLVECPDAISLYSETSINVEELQARNEERMRRLNRLQKNPSSAGQDDSENFLVDPDGFLKQPSPKDGERANSATTLASEPWLRPGTSETLKRFLAEQFNPSQFPLENPVAFQWQGLSTAHG
ncbi:centrosome and spindle pole-associated protein 1-like isoform X1 [Tachyglossus aculeatus]|uniref:centrosome and spindle pole-associated protein 1-like isoform X1 n=1 Tax=Tachyglossus aculeatus TaxID=9261 RepID=UPI0018F611BB|nr:centrosome and spindle pole-associated protein 1-like isoform X1 [Tachyglossus aculeatus]